MLSEINYFLRTHAYFVIGPTVIIFNIPVFILIIIRKELRRTYSVIAVVFLNNALTGISVILVGLKRLLFSPYKRLISHHECTLNLSILLLTVLCLNGMSLLMNSAERLCVVMFPIYYYTHNTRISYSLIAAQYAVTFIVVFATVVATLIEPIRYVSNRCMLQNVFSPNFYKTILLLACGASFMSAVLMLAVVVILKKKFGEQFLSKNSYNRDLSRFLSNQKRYTQTAIISSCLTFFLVVVPSIVEFGYVMDSPTRSKIIVTCCAYLRLLNSFNMVVLFLYRQRDFRRNAVQYFNCARRRRRRRHVQSIAVVGFGR
ncbi:unnamed protein product [Litomosoides sigmodontis]|uniref:G-protein coupled receptors family 1 profile domain-containing protein n=1 Tax=Litomosoides sigmodontis TaxID=42156 RepID=A0A3P6TIJ9_LITSI|nr:unnamed protein product [Litomosoides sigmodontis]